MWKHFSFSRCFVVFFVLKISSKHNNRQTNQKYQSTSVTRIVFEKGDKENHLEANKNETNKRKEEENRKTEHNKNKTTSSRGARWVSAFQKFKKRIVKTKTFEQTIRTCRRMCDLWFLETCRVFVNAQAELHCDCVILPVWQGTRFPIPSQPTIWTMRRTWCIDTDIDVPVCVTISFNITVITASCCCRPIFFYRILVASHPIFFSSFVLLFFSCGISFNDCMRFLVLVWDFERLAHFGFNSHWHPLASIWKCIWHCSVPLAVCSTCRLSLIIVFVVVKCVLAHLMAY